VKGKRVSENIEEEEEDELLALALREALSELKEPKIQMKKNSYKIVFGSGATNGGVSTLIKTFMDCCSPSREEHYHATIDYERIELDYTTLNSSKQSYLESQ
jgi:hypothetical protein